MCRYFNFDDLLNSVTNTEIQNLYGKKLSSGLLSLEEDFAHVLRDQVFRVLLFFSRNRENGICQKSLIALGKFFNLDDLLNKLIRATGSWLFRIIDSRGTKKHVFGVIKCRSTRIPFIKSSDFKKSFVFFER